MQELTARDRDNGDWRRELSISYSNVGGILEAQGKLQEALAEYEADKRIMQELTARDPDNAGWRRDLGVAQLVGVVLQAQGRLPEALAEHEAGRRIMQELTTRDPDNAGWQRELAVAHNRRLVLRRRASCRRRWRRTRLERIMQELTAARPGQWRLAARAFEFGTRRRRDP